MIATDFMYDGIFLSDFGYIMCRFDDSGGLNTTSAGSQLTFNKVAVGNGERYYIAGAHYDECFETSFDICKCDADTVTLDEYSSLMRWLNRKEVHELLIRTTEWDAIRYYGTFNVSKIEVEDRIIGFTLYFTSNSPFGRMAQETDTFTISSADGSIVIYDESDEIGFIYPDYLEIKCNSGGDLTITNSMDGRMTSIKGCAKGEVIVFDGTVSTVTTSAQRKILNSFNFVFPRIGNTAATAENRWTFSLPCDVTLKYSPIRKVVF